MPPHRSMRGDRQRDSRHKTGHSRRVYQCNGPKTRRGGGNGPRMAQCNGPMMVLRGTILLIKYKSIGQG